VCPQLRLYELLGPLVQRDLHVLRVVELLEVSVLALGIDLLQPLLLAVLGGSHLDDPMRTSCRRRKTEEVVAADLVMAELRARDGRSQQIGHLRIDLLWRRGSLELVPSSGVYH
jgi:hypothetical protein